MIVPLVSAASVAAALVVATGWSVWVWSRSRRAVSDEILNRHLELSLDLICTASFNGHFVRLSPSWTSTLGYSVEELTRRPFTDFIHPDDLERTLAEVEKQAETGRLVFNFQNRYRHADGSYRWLEWTSRPDYEAGLMFAVARDITQRKQAEEIIAHHQEILEQTVSERTAELEQARWETLRCLALAAEYRDDQTYEHTQRVGRTSAALAEQLGLEAHFVELIRHAAPLHDVGKLGIPDAILLKPAKLTAEEFELVREHAAAGAKILGESSSELLQLAEEIAFSHHEWWDGSGYPRGLAGEEIPLSGRIVAVADVFDALTHERPYKHAWPVPDSVREMFRLSGRQFDPAVLESFRQLDPDQLAGRKPHEPARRLRAVS